MKDIYIEHYKTWIKDIDEDMNKLKAVPCSSEELILLKYLSYASWFTGSMQPLSKFQCHFHIYVMILKFILNHRKTMNNAIWAKRTKLSS
jgi:hypothetical protein